MNNAVTQKNVPKRDDSIISVTLLVLAGLTSLQPGTFLILLSSAFHNYYKYVISSPVPDSLSLFPLLANVAFFVYLLTFPVVITLTVISLRKKRIIFWLPLAYLIFNIVLYVALKDLPYWKNFTF